MTYHKDYLKIFLLRTIGNFLLLSAIAGVVLTFAPVIGAEVVYRFDQYTGKIYYVAADEGPKKKPDPGSLLIARDPKALAITPLDTNFGIVIPKIAANAKVVADVDPGDQKIYAEALRKGVAHAAGTVYPGEVGNSFLFAHSVGSFWEVSRWNAVFYLLRELSPGDEVDVFYQGKRYVYLVYDKKIVEPSEVGYLNSQANFPMLTLQTCWPPGTTLKRLLVFGRLRNG